MSYFFEENLNCSIFMLINNESGIGLNLQNNTYIKTLSVFSHLNGPAYFSQNDIKFDNDLQCYTLPNGYNYFIEVNLVQGLDASYPNKFDISNGNLPYVYDPNSTTTFSQTAFIIENGAGQKISNVASSTFLYENSSAINSAIAFLRSPNDPNELVKFKIKHLGNSYTLLDMDNSSPAIHPEINNGSLRSRILVKAFPVKSQLTTPDYSNWLNKNNINRNISWILYNNKTLTTSKAFESYYQKEISDVISIQNDNTISSPGSESSNYFFDYTRYYQNNPTVNTFTSTGNNPSYSNKFKKLQNLLYFNDNSKNFVDAVYSTNIRIAYPKSSFFLKESDMFLSAFNPYPCYLEINFKKNKIRWGMFHSNSSITSTYTASTTTPIVPSGVKIFPQLEKLVQKIVDVQTINGIENIIYSTSTPYNQCYIIDLMAIKFGWVFKHPLTINIVLPDSVDESTYKGLNMNPPIFNDLTSLKTPNKGDKICFIFKYFDKKLLLGESIMKQQSLYSDYGPQYHFIHDTTSFDNYEFMNHMSGPLINKKICLFISNTSIHDSYGSSPSTAGDGKALLLSTNPDNIPSYFYSGNLLMEYLNERSSINLEWNGFTWTNQKEVVVPNTISSIEKVILPNFRKNKLKLLSNIPNQPNLSYSIYTNLPDGSNSNAANSIISRQGKFTYVKVDNLINFSYKTNITDYDDMFTSNINYTIDPNIIWQNGDIIVFKHIREVDNSKSYTVTINANSLSYTPAGGSITTFPSNNISATQALNKNRISIKDNSGLVLTNAMPVSIDSNRKDYIFKYNGTEWEVLQKEDLILSFKQNQLMSFTINNDSQQQLTIPNGYTLENIVRYTFNSSNSAAEYYLPVINSNLLAGTQLIFEMDSVNNPTGSFLIKDTLNGKSYSDLTSSTSNRKIYVYQYDGIDWIDVGDDYVIINELPTSTHALYKEYIISSYPSFSNPTLLPASSSTIPQTTQDNYLYQFNSTRSGAQTYTINSLDSTKRNSFYFEFVGPPYSTGSFTIKDSNGQNIFDTVDANSAVKKYAIEWNGSKWCILNELKYLQNY